MLDNIVLHNNQLITNLINLQDFFIEKNGEAKF